MEIYEIVNMYNSTLIEDFILRIKQTFIEYWGFLCVLVRLGHCRQKCVLVFSHCLCCALKT